jgi:hypothetical protein
MATPSLGQTPVTELSAGQKQHLTCTSEGQRLLCTVQSLDEPQSEQVTQTFEQAAKTENGTLELTPVRRTALFNPELDGMLSTGLLWTFYLSLPIVVAIGIWHNNQQNRAQVAKLAQQIATLERIWHSPTTR